LYRITWQRHPLKGGFPGRRHIEYVVVMANCLSYYSGKDQQMVREIQFDLKAWGLKHGRDVGDLQRFTESGVRLTLSPMAKDQLREQLKRDLAFLVDLQVNDYSLLVGVTTGHHQDGDAHAMMGSKDHVYAHSSTDGEQVYFLSLIDVLSAWTWNRRLAYYIIPGIWVYFPRYLHPECYARRLQQTVDHVLGDTRAHNQ